MRAVSTIRDVYVLRTRARLEWLNVHHAEVVLANSYFSRESLLRAYARESRVCYLGVDTELFRPLDLPREHFVIGLGAMDPNKGVADAIRAVAALPAPRPALVWVSDRASGPYAAEMRTLAERSNVVLRAQEAVSDHALIDLLNRASVMIYTSHLEPFGLAPLEASACGTPVVAVAEGGVRESVLGGVNGVLVDRDPCALAAAMRAVMERAERDPSAARLASAGAVAHVRAHWTKVQSVDRLEPYLLRGAGSRECDTRRSVLP